jgi:hypothetical protein
MIVELTVKHVLSFIEGDARKVRKETICHQVIHALKCAIRS